MNYKPFNKNFWFTLIAIIFAGGLVYGQTVGLNDVLDRAAATVGNAIVFTPERVEIRHIDSEIQTLLQEPLESDFLEIDDALKNL